MREIRCVPCPRGKGRGKRKEGEQYIWPNEFKSLEESKELIAKWIELDYNKLYVHSKLGYRSPEEFEALFDQTAAAQAA